MQDCSSNNKKNETEWKEFMLCLTFNEVLTDFWLNISKIILTKPKCANNTNTVSLYHSAICWSKHPCCDRKSTSQCYNYQYSQQLVPNNYQNLLSQDQYTNITDPNEIIQIKSQLSSKLRTTQITSFNLNKEMQI